MPSRLLAIAADFHVAPAPAVIAALVEKQPFAIISRLVYTVVNVSEADARTNPRGAEYLVVYC